MYLTVSAVLTLMLLAWHFSIQAAAHDAAIVQVRAWMQSIGASAGHVQFRLLRGALTIDNIKANIQGSPLHIDTLFFKGNPTSITTKKPLLQKIKVQGFSLDGEQMFGQITNRDIHIPPSLQNLFRYVKSIQIQNGEIYNLPNQYVLHLSHIHMTGMPQNRAVTGMGKFTSPELGSGQWQLQSYIPDNVGQQTGEVTAKINAQSAELVWAGLWSKQNMHFSLQHLDPENNSSIYLNFGQRDRQWTGQIQTQAYPIHFNSNNSIITGNIEVSGTPKNWNLHSPKLLWEETFLPEKNLFIQKMTSFQTSINQAGKTWASKRINIEDLNIDISPEQPLFSKTDWQGNISNINIQNLFSSFGLDENGISLPPLNGVASLNNNVLTFDLSEQVDKNQFWRIRTAEHGKVQVTTTAVPLVQLRSFLPNPIKDQLYTMDGLTDINLLTDPNQGWKTSGRVNIKNLELASKQQSFNAQAFQLDIQQADINGMQKASLQADQWRMKFPLTPRQAWSEQSHLDAWAQIPWSLDNIFLQNGTIRIGNQDNIWLDRADIKVKHWQQQVPAKISLNAVLDGAPVYANMHLIQKEKKMAWQALDFEFKHANLFFLKDWLEISGLPQAEMGHISMSLSAERKGDEMSGQLDFALHRLRLLPLTTETKFLTPLQSDPYMSGALHNLNITTSFSGQELWSIAAGHALTTEILKTKKNETLNNTNKKVQKKILGSLRIQQDIRLSLNERTRLRKIIKQIRQQRRGIIELTPDLGTLDLTPTLKTQVMQTQMVIQNFMRNRGIQVKNIYAVLPQEKHKSGNDIGAVHITLAK